MYIITIRRGIACSSHCDVMKHVSITLMTGSCAFRMRWQSTIITDRHWSWWWMMSVWKAYLMDLSVFFTLTKPLLIKQLQLWNYQPKEASYMDDILPESTDSLEPGWFISFLLVSLFCYFTRFSIIVTRFLREVFVVTFVFICNI